MSEMAIPHQFMLPTVGPYVNGAGETSSLALKEDWPNGSVTYLCALNGCEFRKQMPQQVILHALRAAGHESIRPPAKPKPAKAEKPPKKATAKKATKATAKAEPEEPRVAPISRNVLRALVLNIIQTHEKHVTSAELADLISARVFDRISEPAPRLTDRQRLLEIRRLAFGEELAQELDRLRAAADKWDALADLVRNA